MRCSRLPLLKSLHSLLRALCPLVCHLYVPFVRNLCLCHYVDGDIEHRHINVASR